VLREGVLELRPVSVQTFLLGGVLACLLSCMHASLRVDLFACMCEEALTCRRVCVLLCRRTCVLACIRDCLDSCLCASELA
jgi:hypothetical protein